MADPYVWSVDPKQFASGFVLCDRLLSTNTHYAVTPGSQVRGRDGSLHGSYRKDRRDRVRTCSSFPNSVVKSRGAALPKITGRPRLRTRGSPLR